MKILLLTICLFSVAPMLRHRAAATAGKAVDAAYEAISRTAVEAPQSLTILWDRGSLTQVSSGAFAYAAYARLVQLHDKSLLCVYEAEGSIMATRSLDLGRTWNRPAVVAWRQDGINMAAPDLIELQDHSIIVCYNPRPYKISGSLCFGIRTRKSYDGGSTWRDGRLPYEAGHRFGDGCWEPSMIQLPGGEVNLFFANESSFRKSDEQNISLLRSQDGGLSWNETPEVVSFRHGARDGMPSPLLLQNQQEIVCAIEDTGWLGYFKPAIIRTKLTDNWTKAVAAMDRNRDYIAASSIGLRLYAGAPFLRQLSTGETLLSYQGTEGRPNNMRHADMKVVIGDSDARHFGGRTEPFDFAPRYYGLWNSLAVLDDDTVVALTSTNAFTERSSVWMIKGYVIRQRPNHH